MKTGDIQTDIANAQAALDRARANGVDVSALVVSRYTGEVCTHAALRAHEKRLDDAIDMAARSVGGGRFSRRY